MVSWVEQVPYILLIGLRVSGLFIMSPVFGRANLPVRFRLGLALLLTYLLLGTVPLPAAPMGDNLYAYALAALQEFLMGLVLGFVTSLFLSVALTAGQMIDMQMGFGMVNILDPHSQQQVPLIGNLLNLLGLLLFFAVDGHLDLIRILSATLLRIPPGSAVPLPRMATALTAYFASVFVLAVRLAVPVFAAALMAETALGILMRTVPQMNVFVVGIPLKILLGLIVILVILPVYGRFMNGVFGQLLDAVDRMYESWVPL